MISRLLFLLVVFCAGSLSAQAATLSLPVSASYAPGQVVTIPVLVSTAAGESANAISATISYPLNLLRLTSLSKGGSIITLWPEEPQHSEADGTVMLEGIILNPGWSGTGGRVLTLTFIAERSGTGSLAFADAQVLANDGKGSDILTAAPPSGISVVSPTPAVPTTGIAPQITSSTHPNQNAWYRARTATFSWTVPAGTSAVRLLYDRQPTSIPTVEYAPPVAQKEIKVLVDGIYYFHAQFKTAEGWGPVRHYKFQIDTTAPLTPSIRLAHGTTTDPRPILLFNTTDAHSGIERYEVKIGDEPPLTLPAETVDSNPYSPPFQEAGDRVVTVTAYDRAGNAVTSTTTITIEFIDTPKITEYPSQVQEGELIRIRGTTYPGATVTITLTGANGIVSADTALANDLGYFGLVWTRPLSPGIYTFTAQAVDTRGGISLPTDPYAIKVEYGRSSLLLYLGILLFIVMGGAIVVLYRRTSHIKRVKHGELLVDAFRQSETAYLQELLTEQRVLEKTAHERSLTAEEKKTLAHLKAQIASVTRDLK